MLIRPQATPNPEALKFVIDRAITEGQTVHFTGVGLVRGSELARGLFELEGVREVFIGPDFITILKESGYEWKELASSVVCVLMEYLMSGEPVLREERKEEEEGSEVAGEIKRILEREVNVVLLRDGGEVEFERFEEGIVYVRLKGSCSGCPHSFLSLKGRVERVLRAALPQIEGVRAVGGPEGGRRCSPLATPPHQVCPKPLKNAGVEGGRRRPPFYLRFPLPQLMAGCRILARDNRENNPTTGSPHQRSRIDFLNQQEYYSDKYVIRSINEDRFYSSRWQPGNLGYSPLKAEFI